MIELNSFSQVLLILWQTSSRVALSLQQDSTSFFQKLLRMFLNTFAAPGTKPYDVPYAMTVVGDTLIV